MRLLFGETHELGFPERDCVGEEREQGFSGAILESRDDFGHGIEHAERHRSGHGGDGDGFDFHKGWLCVVGGKRNGRHKGC